MRLAEKLIRHAERRENGCLEWVGGRDPDGYGIIRAAGRSRRVHRVAWELANGPIPDGLLIRHCCDNPPCIDPAHLLAGSSRDNVLDMYDRGRASDRRGENCPTARLTWPQVREIRQRLSGGCSTRDVAAEFGVSRRAIRKIASQETWKDPK